MRMKHGIDRGPTISVKPRLLAAFTAVAMMFATAVPALMPKVAQAAEAGICATEDIELGDNINDPTETSDTGVATWVGRDFYVGSRPAGKDITLDASNKPGQSYAAEAEGLTIVQGKFANNKVGNSWNNNGFRIGAVGFGAMFRPATGNTTLAVGGVGSNIKTMTTGGKTGNVGAWEHGSFVGKGNSNQVWFTAQIAGEETAWQSNIGRTTVVGNEGAWTNDKYDFNGNKPLVTYGAPQPLTVNGVDYSEWSVPDDTSEILATITNTFIKKSADPFTDQGAGKEPGIYIGDAPEGTHWRHRYDTGTINAGFTFEKGDEKLITFNGDGQSLMQVFTIAGSELSSSEYSGLDFAFANIPANASVVVNVTGTGNVTFQNGWRFWWNGNEIGDGYVQFNPQGVDNKDRADYGAASQTIMWNFANTELLTIKGGSYLHKTGGAHADKNNNDGDDPSAAMLGSIMVPNGSFDDHVTTNGRVWVGVDFMMNNPDKVGSDGIGGAESASIVGMDQERHNFPWRGSMSTQCSTISWTKVDESGGTLGGSAWGIYKSLDDAKKETNPLYRVVDNNTVSGDRNPADGKFRVDNLNSDADYYIRESNAPEGFKVNTNIYVIHTKTTGDVSNKEITAAYNSSGNTLPADQWQIMNVPAQAPATGGVQGIINTREGGSVSWGKYEDGTSEPYAGLEGSEWTLKKADGTHLADIVDNTLGVESVRILNASGGDITGNQIDVMENEILNLSAKALLEGAPQGVTWESSHPDEVGVQDGHVVIFSVPENDEVVTITARSTDNDQIAASITLKIAEIPCQSLTLRYNGKDYADDTLQITLDKGATAQVNTKTDPEGLHVDWTSSNESVATVQDGKVTAVGAGTATVTARCKDKERTFTVTVSDGLTVYLKWDKYGSGSNVKLGWKTASHTWTTEPMTYISGCADYNWKVTISTNMEAAEVKPVANDKDWYAPTANKDANFAVAANTRTYGITGGQGKALSTIPCAVAGKSQVRGLSDPVDVQQKQVSRAKQQQRAILQSAEQDADVQTQADAPSEGAPAETSYTDQNSKIGQFTIVNLPPGTYTLQEKTAPSGYLLNPTVYTFTIGADGKLTWGGTPKTTAVYVHYVDGAAQTPRILYWEEGKTEPTEEAAAKAPSMTIEPCGGADGWYKYDVPIAGKAFNVKITVNGAAYEVGNKNPVIAIDGKADAYTIDLRKVEAKKPAEKCPTATTTIYVQSTDQQPVPRILYWQGDTQPAWGDNNANGLVMSAEACAGNGLYKYDVPITNTPFNVQVKIGNQLLGIDGQDVISVDGTKDAYTIADGKVSDKVPSTSCPALRPPSIVGDMAWISDKPTQVVWEKVDSDNGNAPLAGSGWTIEQKITGADGQETWKTINEVLDCTESPCNASVEYKDEDPTPGKFLVKKLPVGTYRISETTVPNGYDAVGGPYEFTVTDSEETVHASPKPIGNNRKKGTVYWGKVSSEDDTRYLTGSEWKITYTPEGGTKVEYTIKDCDASDSGSENCRPTTEATTPPLWAFDTDTAEGKFKLTDLPWGDYVIVETKAPDGYYLDSTEHKFTVGPDSDTVKLDWNLGNIENTPGVVLPATGGEGNTLIVLFGFALIAISMVGCGVAMRKRI